MGAVSGVWEQNPYLPEAGAKRPKLPEARGLGTEPQRSKVCIFLQK